MKSPFMRLWGAPILLAVLTIAGLVCALVGDGVWDLASAVALAIPVLTGAWHGLRRRA
ncbi:hypothetical protein Jab_2c06690 [Janthinobacterium sp. HH01]|uniref:hypothetical protein n=1 Tax=Janthinobacterium sp. HH01 TaxID=1198452 RepID=UPI0002AE988B|nr:hypothetical protein [Janthinobacterium sp. HH01]ELX08614.1 hypothetical protein Jab_2c06690 [Janthinobacterium sp. HH01]